MNTFPKSEKLCGQLRIAALYKEGRRFVSFPLRVTYRRIDGSSEPVRVLIWAPKSLFKHAVDRNHVKRLTREAYRKQKLPLWEALNLQHKTLEVAWIYVDNKFISYEETYTIIGKAISRLVKIINTK